MNWFTTWLGTVAASFLVEVPMMIFAHNPSDVWWHEVFYAGGAFSGCLTMHLLRRAGYE